MIDRRLRLAQLSPTHAQAQVTAPMEAGVLDPMYHHGYDHENGTYFSLGDSILDERSGE